MNKENNTLEPGAEIRALWWKQPYADLMLRGKIETRIWPTEYRGLVLICASKNMYSRTKIEEITGLDILREHVKYYMHTRNGIAIAVGRLVDCRQMTKGDEVAAFVKYREPWIECKKSKKISPKNITKWQRLSGIYPG